MKILYLDDDAINRLIVSEKVAGKYEIDAVETTTQFFDLLDQNTYNIFLIDINLNNSDIDGFGVLEKIKERNLPKETFYIAHTNYFGENWKKRCLDNGFDFYLPKPFVMSVFDEYIHK
ncbi:MAG: response regulator [Flavobacteriaceae bacterium]|nr:response regulator [Flavobacteriaceae bacterium]